MITTEAFCDAARELTGADVTNEEIIDEEGFIGMDVRLLDYLFIDTGIRLSQMHSLREETVLEIIRCV